MTKGKKGGERRGKDGEEKNGRKKGWKEKWKNRRKGGRKEGRKKKKKGQRTSPTLVLLDLPFLYYSLSCSKISLGALQGAQHLVPGLSVLLRKAVCKPPPTPICFTGQHLPSPAGTAPLIWGSQPQEGCIS